MTTSTVRDVKLPARIVVGIDESGLADHAIEAALSLSARLQAELELLHVIPELPDSWPGIRSVASLERSESMVEAARTSALAHVREILRRRKDTHHSAERLVRVLVGHPAQALMTRARSASDMIMLGARRQTGVLHFGGTLRTVLAKSAGPVWVQGIPWTRFDRILAPIDLSENGMHALALAVAIAGKLNARVHALHVFDSTYITAAVGSDWYGLVPVISTVEVREAVRRNFDDSMAEFPWHGVEHDLTFADGHPTRVILDQAQAHDLVVMGTHGHTGLAAAVLGNTAWSVLDRCDKPLLVVRQPGRAFSA